MLTNEPIIRGFQYGYYVEPWAMPLFVIAGVLGFFATLWVAKGLGKVHGMWAKTMLVGRFEGGNVLPSRPRTWEVLQS